MKFVVKKKRAFCFLVQSNILHWRASKQRMLNIHHKFLWCSVPCSNKAFFISFTKCVVYCMHHNESVLNLFVCFHLLLVPQMMSSFNVVLRPRARHSSFTPARPIMLSVLWRYAIKHFVLLLDNCKPLRLRHSSVVLTIRARLSAKIPSSPILLPVKDLKMCFLVLHFG